MTRIWQQENILILLVIDVIERQSGDCLNSLAEESGK